MEKTEERGRWPYGTAPDGDVQVDPIRTDAPYVYSIQVGAGGLFFGGWLNIAFYPYGQISNNAMRTFSGGFGGLVVGTGDTWGTAWFNYDVNWLAEQGWHANFEANFPPGFATQINLWGLSGEYIGSTVAGGISLMEGVVGGQGWFW
jgi:hypothetical protein